MKRILRTLFQYAVVLALSCPVLVAQGGKDDEEKPHYPTTGVRFVICSSSGGNAKSRIPSTLYAKYGKGYLPVHISARMPGDRVTPEADGNIRLYDQIPEDEKQEIKPVITIPVPAEYLKGKVTAIVVPAEEIKKSQFFFLRESEFPTGGFHIINFAPSQLEFLYSATEELPERGIIIAPFKRKDENTVSRNDPNVWSFSSKKNKDVKSLTYVLCVPAEGEGGMRIPIRQSKFAVDPSLSQIFVVVKHPSIPNAFRLLSINFNYEADKRNEQASQQGAAGTQPSAVPTATKPRRRR